MTYLGKRLPISEYQKCFDMLNGGKLNNPETYRQFLVSVFEVAKIQMGCEDCQIEFCKFEKENYGRASEMENIVKINLLNAKPRLICQNISTIYHELVHIQQHKSKGKKQLGYAKSVTLPFEESIHPYILDEKMLGVHPFLVYFCSNAEKQARDVGYYEAARFFENMDKLSACCKAKGKTQKVIQKSKKFFEDKFAYEQIHYKIACDAVESFVKDNPDFVKKALDNVFADFCVESSKVGVYNFDRMQQEMLVVSRIDSLVELGCDDECKNKIIEFLTTELVFKKYILLGLLHVVDSPYAKITKQDFELVFDYAMDSGDFNKDLVDCFQNWKKEDVIALMKQYAQKQKTENKTQREQEFCLQQKYENSKNINEECQIY